MFLTYFDKFLKVLKTDRTTFVTYILTLLTGYFLIDRIVEILFIAGSGLSVNYWGPLQYTFAFACATFAFYFSFASKFASGFKPKVGFLYGYIFTMYFLGISMLIQWENQLCWYLLFCVPGYKYIITNFMDLIKPAFSAFAWYVPIISLFPTWKFVYTVINDVKPIQDSIRDYPGISLNPSPDGTGPYTCENTLCRDLLTGKMLKIPEIRRFESAAVVGVSGAGKTSMIYEPMIARDLEKKYFFKEASKEMGYTALRTGLAVLDRPYSSEYLNKNFTLKMLVPVPGKEKLYNLYISKLIYYKDNSKIIYRDLGLTYMAPDYETLIHMKDVAENFNINYKIIDPEDPNSIGLNPFVGADPIKTSIAISSILKRLVQSQEHTDGLISVDEAFSYNILTQSIENLVVLLKIMHPKLHDGELPTLEDLLALLTDFSKVEELSKKLKSETELAKNYSIQISYFEKNFYKRSINKDLKKQLGNVIAIIENLLRNPGIKNILCNKTNNVNYDNVLENGEIIFICTRRGGLGGTIHRGFGIYCLLLMQQSILTRPGIENSRTPYFLYVDEFSPFLCSSTEEMFTLYRKYRVGIMISAQNLAQLGQSTSESGRRETVLSNCATKVVFGGSSPDDNEWWQKEFGDHREWKMTNDYQTDKGTYDPTYKGVLWTYKENHNKAKIQTLPFKTIIFRTKTLAGKFYSEMGEVDFLETKYKEPQKVKTFNFNKFTNGITNKDELEEDKKKKFDLKNISFNSNPNNPNDMEPIQTNTSVVTDFDESDAIKNYTKPNND